MSLDIDKEFKKWLDSLSEEEKKRVEEELSKLGEKEKEFAKTYLAIARLFEEKERARREVILNAINKEELEKVSKEDLIIALHGVIWQACGDDYGNVDSRALSLYADAMRLLARLGVLEIEREYGRRVIGKLKGVDV